MEKIYTACDLVSVRDYPYAINDEATKKKAADDRAKDIKWAISHDLRTADRHSAQGFSPLPALGIVAAYLIFVLWS